MDYFIFALLGSSDVSAVGGSDFYEAVVMPKQSGDPLTLCLTQRQPHPSANLLPQYDLDPSVPHGKGHTSMPPTNPSSIWSIAETDKEPPSSQTSSNRFPNAAAQFLNHGSRSSHIGSTSSCDRPGKAKFYLFNEKSISCTDTHWVLSHTILHQQSHF